MHPAPSDLTCPSELFTRERRRRRMREFLETFEHHTWTSSPELHRLMPVVDDEGRNHPVDLTEQAAK